MWERLFLLELTEKEAAPQKGLVWNLGSALGI